MRVVHVYKTYPPVRGGIEGHIDLLTRLLAQRGVAPEVLCVREPGTPAREERQGVRVRRCPSLLTLASTPLPPTLPWALRHSAADLVHLHFPWPPGEVAWLLGGRARPLVVTVHCEAVRQARLAMWLAPLTQRVLAAAGRIVVTGAFMRDAVALAAHRDRVRVIPLGVDLEHFSPDPTIADPLPRIARPRVVFVGRLRHYKGLPVLAAALARLPQAQLVVVGEGSERGRFEAALRTHGCRDRAYLLGDVSDDQLLRILRTADAAVLPSTSRAEAFGVSIAEAQACGVPAVTTEVGTGTAQAVVDGVSGRVVSPNDPAALANGLAWCLDPVAAPTRRAAARAYAEQALSAHQMTAAVHRLYDELLVPA
ncbi:MAG: glycosyltransferase [Deltaproteobacteria bacterium]|nr:glycosyltransferase [Deltaproteobacteria bacterium]MBI3387979.1 glycosyltransferase [Deltaproteobacteria bacterium]